MKNLFPGFLAVFFFFCLSSGFSASGKKYKTVTVELPRGNSVLYATFYCFNDLETGRALAEELYGVKNLDKSIKIETDDFISKVRDLALGSAPTDVLTILGGLGTLGYYLGKSKDSDERVSIVRSGIIFFSRSESLSNSSLILPVLDKP